MSGPGAPTTMAQRRTHVIAGVDTHRDTHTAAALDHNGRELGVAQFPATARGYRDLLAWLTGLGVLERVGIEGTGCYGAGLSTYLAGRHVQTLE